MAPGALADVRTGHSGGVATFRAAASPHAPAPRRAPRRSARTDADGGYGTDEGPYAVAHRGGAGLAPENTFEAFERSVALGVRYLETDVQLTADGVLVAFHDERLDRVTDLRGRVDRHPWSVLRTAAVRGGGAVMTLTELLEAFPQQRFAVDLKTGAGIGPLARVLVETGSVERVCVAGAWDGWLAHLRDACGPGLRTALGWRSLATLVGCARSGLRPPVSVATGDFVHVPVSLGRVPLVADRLVAMAADLGVRVLVWTVDEPALMHRLLDLGVDGVITDRPDLLREVLVQRGQWRPMAG